MQAFNTMRPKQSVEENVMSLSDKALWGGAIIFIFFALYIIGTLIRNSAAKKDRVGRSEADTVATNVSVNPQKNTRKLDYQFNRKQFNRKQFN